MNTGERHWNWLVVAAGLIFSGISYYLADGRLGIAALSSLLAGAFIVALWNAERVRSTEEEPAEKGWSSMTTGLRVVFSYCVFSILTALLDGLNGVRPPEWFFGVNVPAWIGELSSLLFTLVMVFIVTAIWYRAGIFPGLAGLAFLIVEDTATLLRALTFSANRMIELVNATEQEAELLRESSANVWMAKASTAIPIIIVAFVFYYLYSHRELFVDFDH